MINRLILAITALLLGLAVSSLSVGRAVSQQAQEPVPVVVVTLQAQTVTLTSTLPGRVAASAEAEVRPQVNGIITERLFREGALSRRVTRFIALIPRPIPLPSNRRRRR